MNLTQRPFQLVVLGIFGFLAIAGIVLFSRYSGGGSAALGTVTIWGTLPGEAVTAQIQALQASDNTYAGVSYEEHPAATFDQDLAQAIAAGSGPDLVLVSQELLPTEQNKLSVIPFSSIPERTYLDTYLPINELFLTTTGTFGVPYAVDPLVLYYNRSLLSSAGYVNPPSTWEGVTGMTERLTRKEGGQISQSAVALGEYTNTQNARAVLSLLLFQAGTSITAANANGIRSTLTETASAATTGVSPLESALNFYVQFADPAKTVYSWNRALPLDRQAFTNGDLALYMGYASEQPSIAASNPNLDYDMAPMPRPGTAPTRMTYGRAYAFAVPKASKNPTGALTTAMALADATQAAPTARLLSMAPATKAGLVPAADNRFEPVFFGEALIARGWLSPSPSVTDSIFAAMIGNITSGRSLARDALVTAEQAINAAI